METKDIKLQFRFSQEALKALDSLKDRGGFATRADFVRRTIRNHDFFQEKAEDGYVLQLIKDDKKEVVPWGLLLK